MAENLNVYHIDCEKYILNNETKPLPHKKCEVDGVEVDLDSERILETETNDSLYCTFIIKCDNDEDKNSFDIDYYGDDIFVVKRSRCNLNVYITPNKSPNDKNFTIVCTHANDADVYVKIDIVQKADEYDLSIDTESVDGITFDEEQNLYETELNSIITTKFRQEGAYLNYNFYEEREINIDVLGGSQTYEIETILRCHINESDSNIISYQNFDNGFVYNKFPNSLVLRNYGRPFLEENDYYLIRLHHKDYDKLKIEIKVTYSKVSRRLLTLNRKANNNMKPNYNVSDIYSSYNNKEKEFEEIEEVEEEVFCEIKFNEEIGGEMILVGQPPQISLPFEVYENGKISDLMVKTNSSGSWCSVSTDDTNRNLLIKIKDKPILERKTIVNVSIIDYPEFRVSFVLKNSPQYL